MVQFALPKNSTIEKGKHFPSDSRIKKFKNNQCISMESRRY